MNLDNCKEFGHIQGWKMRYIGVYHTHEGHMTTRHLQPMGNVTYHFVFSAWQNPKHIIPSTCSPRTHWWFAFPVTAVPKAGLTWGCRSQTVTGCTGEEGPAPLLTMSSVPRGPGMPWTSCLCPSGAGSGSRAGTVPCTGHRWGRAPRAESAPGPHCTPGTEGPERVQSRAMEPGKCWNTSAGRAAQGAGGVQPEGQAGALCHLGTFYISRKEVVARPGAASSPG